MHLFYLVSFLTCSIPDNDINVNFHYTKNKNVIIYQISNFTVVLSSNEMVCAKKAANRNIKLVSLSLVYDHQGVKKKTLTANSTLSIFIEMVLNKTHYQTTRNSSC